MTKPTSGAVGDGRGTSVSAMEDEPISAEDRAAAQMVVGSFHSQEPGAGNLAEVNYPTPPDQVRAHSLTGGSFLRSAIRRATAKPA